MDSLRGQPYPESRVRAEHIDRICSFSSGGKIIQKKNPTQIMPRAHGLWPGHE